MWKANGKTTTLQRFLSPKTEKLSLEGTMDLSRDRLILELEGFGNNRGVIGVLSRHWPGGAEETLVLCGLLSASRSI
jgi:hypothetical protein